jgi:hypothetical protein
MKIDKEKILREFEEKHNVKVDRIFPKDIFRFNDNRFYDLNDIIFDIENKIPVGQIENYADIGTESAINIPFSKWYELKQQ